MSQPSHQDLPERALEIIALQFKVLSDPMRLRLLQALQKGEKNVTELVRTTGCLQSNASKHLSILSKAGMVGRRKAGLNTYYFIADQIIFDLCELMCSKVRRDFNQTASQFSGGGSGDPGKTAAADLKSVQG